MGLNTALSGIRAATKNLDNIGNNIANVGTIGFKQARTEFGDVVAAASTNAVGSGTAITAVTQQFSQGNTTFTNNVLDLSIQGEGFFQVSANGNSRYTRSGAFGVDNAGFIVNSSGERLVGFLADANGEISGTTSELSINTENIAPRGTSETSIFGNLDASAAIPTVGFDPTVADSFNGDPVPGTVFDSLGGKHTFTSYFRKTAPNAWTMFVKIDGQDIGPDAGAPPAPSEASFNLVFNADGSLDTGASDTVTIGNWTPLDQSGNPNGASGPPDSDFTVDISNIKQFGSESKLRFSQDGFETGQFARLQVDGSGILVGQYSNGQTRKLGQVALAAFANVQGLQPVGNTSWIETFSSGSATISKPGSTGVGLLQAGSLEDSNVDLTQSLISLIVAQRNFQANAQTIQTEDAVTQSIINLR